MKRHFAGAGRVGNTVIAVAAAVFAGRGLWDYYMNEPWTRDAHVRADVVEVAPDVAGLVDAIPVGDNDRVHQGDVLFRVDRNRFEIALQQAEAAVSGRKAALDQAERDLARSQRLGEFASRQSVEQAQTTLSQAASAYQQALADRELARLNLARSDVKASVNGIVSNLALQPGDYVSTGKSVMALHQHGLAAGGGLFRGDEASPHARRGPATVRLMGQPTLLHGRVESVAGGIEDRERASGSGLLADINSTLTWVRLAQRVPVRIRLDSVPSDVNLIAGLTATVEIGDPAAPSRTIVGDIRQLLAGLAHAGTS